MVSIPPLRCERWGGRSGGARRGPGLGVGAANGLAVRVGAGAEGGAQQAVDDQVRVAADGRGEVRVAGAGECEVAFVFLAVAGLLERAQHEEGEDALLRSAGDFGREALVHLRGHGDLLGHVVLLGGTGAAAVALGSGLRATAVGFHREGLDGQAGEAEGLTVGARNLFKIQDALGVGQLVDAVDASRLALRASARRTRWR